MLEHENRFALSDEKRTDKLTQKRVIVFLIAIIGLLILIEIHAINKPVEERSVQNPDTWYVMLAGDAIDFVYDIANGDFTVVEKIVNGESIEPFHAEKASNENIPIVDIPSNEVYFAQTTFVAEQTKFVAEWPDGNGSVDIEYDLDGDGIADCVQRVEYARLIPGRQYTVQGRLVLNSRNKGVTCVKLIDETEGRTIWVRD